MSELSSYHRPVERLLHRLERSGLMGRLQLSDQDIADTIWLALQMGVVEAEKAEETETEEKQANQLPPILPIDRKKNDKKDDDPSKEESHTHLYSQDSLSKESKSQTSTQGLPFQVPAAAALQNKLPISRALRPLMRKVPSPIRKIVDAEATVTRIAEQDIWLPLTQPEPERWLNLELVVEESRSSFIWTETIDELQKLLQNHGAFRTVRAWSLSTTVSDPLQLTRRIEGGQKSHCQHSYKELISSNGRGLILLVSDCVSSIWQQEKIYQWLQQWSDRVTTAIVQLLPERLWQSSELGLGDKLPFSAFKPGVPNSSLVLPSLWSELKGKQALKMPVVTLEDFSIKNWAKVVAGRGNARTPGFVFDLEFVAAQIKKSPAVKLQEPSPEELVDRFLATASPTAKRLAGLMAAAPVDLRVVHLIQRTLLPQPSSLVPVAEVFLSGTIQRVDYPRSDRKPQYDFLPEVRKLLNQATRLGETEKVLDVVSSYIADKLGLSIASFTALLLKLQDLSTAQQQQILPFARVAVEVLQNLGGEYAAFAQRVAGNSELEFIGFPPKQVFHVEVATIEVASESDTFEFTVATIEINRSLLSSSNSPVELVDEKVFAQKGEHLNDLEKQLIQGVLANRTYAQIAATSRNSVEHLPENVASNLSKYLQYSVAPNLWQHLSAAFEEKVTKRNAKKLIEQWVAHRHITIHRHRQQAEYFIEYLGNIGNFGNLGNSEYLGNGVELEMVAIPAGSFVMGSPKDELERRDSENPQHRVTIQPFFLGRYPITQAQWQAVASLPQQKRELNPDPSSFKGANRPVENVSWYDAIEFCARLSQATGKAYRLPSEAEWEYAARGGTTTPFHFGETITSELANYNANYTYGAGAKGVYRQETTPVGSFDVANAFGLSDIHGNLWEWCLDPWHGNYEGAPLDGRVWDETIQNDRYLNIVENLDILLQSSEYRVSRGGSWLNYPMYCRCAYRNYAPPDYDSYNLGFRVACGVP